MNGYEKCGVGSVEYFIAMGCGGSRLVGAIIYKQPQQTSASTI